MQGVARTRLGHTQREFVWWYDWQGYTQREFVWWYDWLSLVYWRRKDLNGHTSCSWHKSFRLH